MALNVVGATVWELFTVYDPACPVTPEVWPEIVVPPATPVPVTVVPVLMVPEIISVTTIVVATIKPRNMLPLPAPG